MNANELRELADAISIPTAYTYGPTEPQRQRIAAYLRACADAMEAGPVAWRFKPMFGSPWSLSDDGYYISCKRDQGYITEKLYPLAMPVIPQGWKLVPVEPTLGMSEAGAHSTGDNVDGRPVWKATIDEQAAHIYSAMLASAPTPPVTTLRLPEPMTRAELDAVLDDYGSGAGVRHYELCRWIEAEVLRRVKECNE